MTRRHLLTLATLALALVGATQRADAAEPPINTLKNSFFASRTDTAINGYDTVAYFTDGKPVKGLDSFVTEWMGAKWKFSSQCPCLRSQVMVGPSEVVGMVWVFISSAAPGT